jgi:hypothetical protein
MIPASPGNLFGTQPGKKAGAMNMCKGHQDVHHSQNSLDMAFPSTVNASFLESKRQWCAGLLHTLWRNYSSLHQGSASSLVCVVAKGASWSLSSGSQSSGPGVARVNGSVPVASLLQARRTRVFCLRQFLRHLHYTLPPSLTEVITNSSPTFLSWPILSPPCDGYYTHRLGQRGRKVTGWG